MNFSRVLAGAALTLVFGLSGCGSKKEETKAGEAEVERFHRLWNADEFKPVYDDADMNFRNSQTEDEFVATLEKLKRDYGQFKSAKRRSGKFISDDKVTDFKLVYDSAYERGSVVEMFVYRMTGVKALLWSYDLMSPEAAKKRGVE